ncbi:MAG: hypothetical protein ACJAUV_000868, partial [Flavobacteriales bacterium]
AKPTTPHATLSGGSSYGGGYDDGKLGFGLYSTTFEGNGTNQTVGGMSLRHGDWSVRYENDGWPFTESGLGDGNDSYRSAALQINYLDYSAGFKLFTGAREEAQFKYENEMYDGIKDYSCVGSFCERYPRNWTSEVGPRYRLGAAYFGYQGYQAGLNAERIRHGIQNRFAHGANPQPGFEMLNDDWKGYFNYQSSNPFTLW